MLIALRSPGWPGGCASGSWDRPSRTAAASVRLLQAVLRLRTPGRHWVRTAFFQSAALHRRDSRWSCTWRSSGECWCWRWGRPWPPWIRTSPTCCLDNQVLRGDFYRIFKLALDVFGIVLIVGMVLAAYRRYVLRPQRLRATRSGREPLGRLPVPRGAAVDCRHRIPLGGAADCRRAPDRSPSGGCAGGLTAKAHVLEDMGLARAAARGPQRARGRVGPHCRRRPRLSRGGLAAGGQWPGQAFRPAAGWTRYALLHQLAWWLHALLAFGLIVAIPYTKAFHLISSPANMLLRDPGAAGTAAGGRRNRGSARFATTPGGSCSRWMPAPGAASARRSAPAITPVSRCRRATWCRRWTRQLLRTRRKANGQTPSLHGTVVTPEELWACCTCRACEEVCPVFVQQPRLIVDLRRHLVDQGQVDEGLQDALMNFQRYGNSFGQSARKRHRLV